MSSSSSSSSSATATTSTSTTVNYCSDGKRRIELVPSFQKRYIINNVDGFRLQITAQNGCSIDNEIFRYYRYPTAQIYGGATLDEFTGVCSWPDLLEAPKNQPLTNTSPAVFRKSSIDIVVRTEQLAYDTWDLIKKEVDRLIQTMNEGDIMVASTPYWAGASPPS